MTHGGGTVAGESPDKAEQQESSREKTPGGGGRDPRLSVLREPAPSPVQVDQPTAVFKTLAPRTPEDDAPAEERAAEPEAAAEERAEERAEESETASEAGSEGTEGSEGESDRLRAAVAAWVASDDEAEATEAEAASEDEPVAQEDSNDDADSEADADADAETVQEAAEAPEAADSWFASRKPAEATQEAEDEPEAEPQPEAQAEPEPEADEQEPEPAESTDRAESAESTDRAESAESTDPAESAEPVDQPTAMFKIVRPPVVDQPTTALKMPPAPEPAPAQERPSTFVPLRPDTPAAPAAPAAKASPTPPVSPTPRAPAAAAAPAPTPVPPPSLAEAERTRQQPMPPLPPLDLLAELTNTPPPAPTPMRITLRRVRIWTPLVVLLLIVFAVVQFVRPLPAPTLSLTAAPTFTFEGGELQMPWPTEGQGAAEVEGVGSLGTYGAQKPAPLASVAKTMTAYVILRDHPIKGAEPGPEITIDKKAADEAGAQFESTAAVKEGQTYTEKELVQLLMIPSANNVARLLARWDAGSEAAFVEKMNAAAKDLGMTESTYTDPSGLESTTVSTPQDQLKLAKAVMQYDVFREIVNMPNLTVDGIPGQIENNNNILLEPGVSGIKTGSSTPAGGNLLWSANTVVDGKERRILGIVMGAKDAKLLHQKLQLSIDYSLKLIQQAQKDVTSAAVIRKGQVVGHIDDGLGGRTAVVADKELKAVGWPGLKVDLELTDGGKAVPHTGKAGDVVGQVSIGTGTGKVSSPVSLKTDLVEPGFDKKLTRLG
ncbi:D-alanyl-D-alanine carboxypeptidase family protein [Streptomyces sp. NPDC048370]|uniref:D-alanyl-D-alanine carboxypeptidase family protein n=1 Tax=Streptomyces sp. NPDC048370 TaxID=3365540 RepID=UPI003711EE38